jgi:nucleotide-binding universal stress UspA family protein
MEEQATLQQSAASTSPSTSTAGSFELSDLSRSRTGSTDSGKYFRMMVAVDDSPGAQSAFARAVQLATNRPKDTFLYIVTVNLLRPEYTTTVFERDERAEAAAKADEQRARALLAVYEEQVKDLGFRYKTTIARGEDVKQAIVKRAEELRIDLLITGKRGLGAVKRALLGSVSTYCLNQAKCSVMIVADTEQTA